MVVTRLKGNEEFEYSRTRGLKACEQMRQSASHGEAFLRKRKHFQTLSM